MSSSHHAHQAHAATHLMEDVINDSRAVQGTAKAATAGAAGAVIIATVIGATAPVSLPLLAAGAAAGAGIRFLGRAPCVECP